MRARARDVLASDEQRAARATREPRGEPLVGVRRGAQLMVEMRDAGQAQLAGAASARRMCTSATESDPPDTAATTRVSGRDQIVLADELPDAVEQVHEAIVRLVAEAVGVTTFAWLAKPSTCALRATADTYAGLPAGAPRDAERRLVPEDGLEPSTPRL